MRAPPMVAAIGCVGAALALAAPVRAAEGIGPPTVLFSPSIQAAATSPAKPYNAAPPTLARHPAVAVRRAPLDGKPLIPPATMPARSGPPPEPQPALPLETKLQPLTPASPATAAPSPSTDKPPSS